MALCFRAAGGGARGLSYGQFLDLVVLLAQEAFDEVLPSDALRVARFCERGLADPVKLELLTGRGEILG